MTVRGRTCAGVALGLCVAMLASCRAEPEDAQARFAAWLEQGPSSDVQAYVAYLRAQGVAEILPPHELLRSGRHWQRCAEDEFALPPRQHWAAMVPTLRLAAELRREGLLHEANAVSAHRSAALNACEGGSSRSRHMTNAALDFDLVPIADGMERLCAFWKRQGARHRFGLGFYSARQIHVDTSGHRTWGGDYTRRSSPCARGGETQP